MTPSSPMRGRARVGSALSVLVLVAVVERIDVLSGKGHWVAERAREVHGARDVLAHDCGLDGVPRPGADREDAVAAHQHGGRAVLGERGDDPPADVLVADAGEWADRD